MTRASDTVPKMLKAFCRISSLTSLERSPTKMWWWLLVSSLVALLDW
jgi:hypothetical protein